MDWLIAQNLKFGFLVPLERFISGQLNCAVCSLSSGRFIYITLTPVAIFKNKILEVHLKTKMMLMSHLNSSSMLDQPALEGLKQNNKQCTAGEH